MKIQCDVCEEDEASVFCGVDEAALCAACDRSVHHADRESGNHQRFSLHQPSPKEPPLCDICQANRAFLFCRQDRAILCRECDISVHSANEHTKKHTRFFLTGVKLSEASSRYSASSSSSASASSALSTARINVPKNTAKSRFSPSQSTTVPAPECCDRDHAYGAIRTSSISEYVMETVPGWQVEDLLGSSSGPSGLRGSGKSNGVLPFPDSAFERNLIARPAGKTRSRVHQTQNQCINIAFGAPNASGYDEQSLEFTTNNINSVAVPQMKAPYCSSKRCKTLW